MAESGRKPRRRRAARRWVWLGLLAAGCSASSGGGPRAAERPPAPVSVATAAVRDVPILLRNFGTVEAYNTVAVKSLVGGQIQKVQFREGQSVKAGQTLSQSEMIELIRQLESTVSPRTCPHGRPTMIHLSAEQLARQFARI